MKHEGEEAQTENYRNNLQVSVDYYKIKLL